MVESNIDIQNEWVRKGEKYATEINHMVSFCENEGWENWEGGEPEDDREHLAIEIIELLKKANKNNRVSEFREKFPPAHAPFIELLKTKSKEIIHLEYVENDTVIFIIEEDENNRQAYSLEGDFVKKLNSEIVAIGKSKNGNVLATKFKGFIKTTTGWRGDTVSEFKLNDKLKNLKINQIIPFIDGLRVLITTPKGIFIVSKKEELKIHPVKKEEGWEEDLIMENASLSNNNDYIIVGDLNSDHRVLNQVGEQIGTIGPQSSFPHFSLFSTNDSHMISNSCHFYNGTTIGIETKHLNGIELSAYVDSDLYTTIENQMRVYSGIALEEYYVLGDAFGYIKAYDNDGNCLWKHFLGSTITGIAISGDNQFLWVATGAGIIHKLELNKVLRDAQAIGNSNHFEEFRMLFWKDEPILKW